MEKDVALKKLNYLLTPLYIRNSLIFKNKKEIRVLSRIIINKNVVLKNQTFSNINIDSQDEIESLVKDLKLIYEDHWKKSNQIGKRLVKDYLPVLKKISE